MTTASSGLVIALQTAGLSASSDWLSTEYSLLLYSEHPRRVGKPAVKMMTPVRYILLALFLTVCIMLQRYVAQPVTHH